MDIYDAVGPPTNRGDRRSFELITIALTGDEQAGRVADGTRTRDPENHNLVL